MFLHVKGLCVSTHTQKTYTHMSSSWLCPLRAGLGVAKSYSIKDYLLLNYLITLTTQILTSKHHCLLKGPRCPEKWSMSNLKKRKYMMRM